MVSPWSVCESENGEEPATRRRGQRPAERESNAKKNEADFSGSSAGEAGANVDSEREGFDLSRFLNLCRCLSLSPNLLTDNDFARLADVLFLHGFLPSRDAF
jgi:hypothetical protein